MAQPKRPPGRPARLSRSILGTGARAPWRVPAAADARPERDPPPQRPVALGQPEVERRALGAADDHAARPGGPGADAAAVAERTLPGRTGLERIRARAVAEIARVGQAQAVLLRRGDGDRHLALGPDDREDLARRVHPPPGPEPLLQAAALPVGQVAPPLPRLQVAARLGRLVVEVAR